MHSFVQLIGSLLRRGAVLAAAAAVLCALVLAAVCLLCRRGGRKAFPWGRSLLLTALAGYIALLLYATLFRYTGGGFSDTNLHLFRAWREAWNGCSVQNWLNVLLNVALFVPLGLLLPPLSARLQKWYLTPALGLGCSLLIESLQYLTGRGLFDVDDLFANTLGCALGYCVVMALLPRAARAERPRAKRLAFLALPLAFAAVLTGLFAVYQLKEYGNLEEAPAFTADTGGVVWELQCRLDDTARTAPVYRTEPLDKKACDAFGAAFALRAGTSFPDAYYYDNATIFANHATGDFLMVNYHDRSYEYTLGEERGRLKSAPSEAALRGLLAEYGIDVPQEAVFRSEGEGRYAFSVDMRREGGRLTDGALCCRIREDNRLYKVTDSLVTGTYYKDEAVLSQARAFERLCAGKFSHGERFAHYAPERVQVRSCALDYRVDSKGFYQPVYVFELAAGGESMGGFIVPAMQ